MKCHHCEMPKPWDDEKWNKFFIKHNAARWFICENAGPVTITECWTCNNCTPLRAKAIEQLSSLPKHRDADFNDSLMQEEINKAFAYIRGELIESRTKKMFEMFNKAGVKPFYL